jgi:hypothetical protein
MKLGLFFFFFINLIREVDSGGRLKNLKLYPMKRKVLSILLVFSSGILMTLQAQTIIAGFEDGTASVTSGDGGIDFEVPAAIVANPYKNGINKSDSVVIVQRADGSTIWDDSVKIDFGVDHVYDWSNKLLMNVWVDHPCYIFVTLQNNTSGVIEKWGPFKQWINDTLKWVQLSLLPTSYGAAIHYNPISGSGISNFNEITLRFGNTDNSDSPVLAYIDSINYYQSFSSPDYTIANFEDSSFIIHSSGLVPTASVTSNPYKNGINTSDSILQYDRPDTGGLWSSIVYLIPTTEIFTKDYNLLLFKVYTNHNCEFFVSIWSEGDLIYENWAFPTQINANTWVQENVYMDGLNWKAIDSIGFQFGD